MLVEFVLVELMAWLSGQRRERSLPVRTRAIHLSQAIRHDARMLLKGSRIHNAFGQTACLLPGNLKSFVAGWRAL